MQVGLFIFFFFFFLPSSSELYRHISDSETVRCFCCFIFQKKKKSCTTITFVQVLYAHSCWMERGAVKCQEEEEKGGPKCTEDTSEGSG